MWESTDLITWKSERLVQVEDKTAGMVWAPEALWDANKGQYLVHWASKFYAASDTAHTGTPSNIKIRFACMQSPPPSCVICLKPAGLVRAQFSTSHIPCASSTRCVRSCLSKHSLTQINRHKRLQDFQRTSNLH